MSGFIDHLQLINWTTRGYVIRGLSGAASANIPCRSVTAPVGLRHVNRSRRWPAVATPVRAWRLRLLPPAPTSTRPRAPFAPSHWPTPPLILGARPRIDLRHYWARVRSAAPRAVWPRCPARPRASSNAKLQAPESAFESRHLRPSWSAPPCGPSATDISTRFVRGKPKRRARHVPGSRGSLLGRNSWWRLSA